MNPKGSPTPRIQRHVFVSGGVQGVGFRMATVHESKKYPSLRGFVRNLPDGRVEAVFAGDESEVLAMSAWCKHGPPTADVTQIEVREEAPQDTLPAFHVR